MFKLQYHCAKNALFLNYGKSALFFDRNNGNFSSIVTLLNDCRSHVLNINCLLDNKVYLMILRAVFHSDLTHFKINLMLHKGRVVSEDVLYPVSKIFGADAKCISKREINDFFIYTFLVERQQKAHYQYDFGYYVISNGKNLDKLNCCLERLYAQRTNSSVVGVVGPKDLMSTSVFLKYPGCLLIPDDEIYSDELRFPIARKKNLIFECNEAEKVIILHERILLSADWSKKLENNAPNFDIYTTCIDADNSYRYLDKFGIKYNGYITNRKCHFYYLYSENNVEQFVDGGFFVINMRAFGDAKFDERLHWGELEDVDLILKRKQECNLITFDPDNFVTSEYANHFSLKKNSLLQILYKVFIRRLFFSLYIKDFMRLYRSYFKSKTTRPKY